MENTSKNIDELLRQRLQDAEVPPPAFVWPNVERTLRKRKRRFFLWLLLAGIASTGIWTVWSRPALSSATAGNIRTAPAATGCPASAGQPAAAVIPAQQAAVAPVAVSAGLLTPAAARPSKGAGLTKKSGHSGESATPTATGIATQDPGRTDDERALQLQHPANILLPETTAATETNSGIELLPARLARIQQPAAQPSLQQVRVQTKPKKAPRRCYDFHNNRQAWLVDAYAGPSIGHKSLQTGNPEYTDYLQNRLETEHREIGFNAGVRASYLFAGNFLLRTGLHYDQTVERFEYIDPNYILVNVRITQKFVNGNWVSVTDTVSIQYGSNYLKTYNRFGTLDIPLQAALELRSGPTGVSLNLGGSVNVLFWKRGSILALNEKPASFRPKDEQFDVYKTKVGMSLIGSLQWFYHLDLRTRVFAEPYYRHVLQPVVRAGYPIRQTYGVSGVHIGITRILD